jgi:hypothetical protein
MKNLNRGYLKLRRKLVIMKRVKTVERKRERGKFKDTIKIINDLKVL